MNFLISQLNLNLILLGSLSALNLIIDLKVKIIQDFGISNKAFSTRAINSTIITTWLGEGSMLYKIFIQMDFALSLFYWEKHYTYYLPGKY